VITSKYHIIKLVKNRGKNYLENAEKVKSKLYTYASNVVFIQGAPEKNNPLGKI